MKSRPGTPQSAGGRLKQLGARGRSSPVGVAGSRWGGHASIHGNAQSRSRERLAPVGVIGPFPEEGGGAGVCSI
jgi:hypothetical protein